MKLLFLDELKYNLPKKGGEEKKIYGLSAVLIDSHNYVTFKESFYKELEKIGWDKHLELKGRSVYSKDGDSKVEIGDRIQFMTNVVNLSKSSTGKNSKIQVYLAIKVYPRKEDEFNCYLSNLKEIINKIPKAQSKTKNLMGVYYDNNTCINEKEIGDNVNKYFKKRNYCLFESAFSVKSSLDYPGIMFADYVCYFHQSFLQLSNFRKENFERIIKLLEKKVESGLIDSEEKELESHLKNYKKERKSKELISSLKKVIYV